MPKDADKKLLAELEVIFGEDGLLSEPEDLISYSYDAFVREFRPLAVVLPRNKEQISRVLKLASQEVIPVVPRGAGTNLCGSSVARKGGIIICLSRMNRILELDPQNRLAVVQPGVINADLQKPAQRHNLFYPPDPASKSICTIGGNVALNAGGPRAVKYGVTRDYLLGTEMVLADGQIIRTGGRTAKNVSGYDLTGLICGSEGTLGVLSEITLRLIPKPPASATILACFASRKAAAGTVSKIMSLTDGTLPATLDLMDKVILDLLGDGTRLKLPAGLESLLMIEVDGPESAILEQSEQLEKLCWKTGAVKVERASDPQEAEALWEARYSYTGALCKVAPNVLTEDAVVPVDKLPEIIQVIERLREKHQVRVGVVAHAGDGNLHPEIMTDVNDEKEMSRVEDFIREMYESVIAMGGTLSGEHGIGLGKSKYMKMVCSDREIDLMRRIKAVFDPLNIINPGSFLTQDI